MYLSVIVPAYNEEKALAKNIKKFNNYLSQQSFSYEIIIVNDGSTDQTKAVAKKLLSQIKNLQFIDNKKNKGKGAAVQQGFLAAKGKYRLFLDADNSTSIEHLKKTWPFFVKGYDMVIGSRNHKDAPGAFQALPQPFWKRYIGISGNLIIRLLLIRDIRDTQCGFKVLSQEAAEKIVPKMTVNGFAFDVEMLILARVLDYKIAKIPVYWINCPLSRVGIKGYLATLRDIIKIKFNLLKGKYTTR